MHLRRIVLNNWMAYRGKTELVLEAKAYAVVARLLTDPERSNWCGKSSLFEAVDFALTGRLNSDRKQGADGWVSDGEKEGGVLLEFDDGTVVERARKKSTQLYVTPAGGEKSTKAEAQALLDTMVGLSADDLIITSYFPQRKLAAFILSDPETRMGYVRSWFHLGALENGEERIRSRIVDLSGKLNAIRARLDATVATKTRELGNVSSLAELEAKIGSHVGLLEKERDRLNRLQGVLANNAVLVQARAMIANYEAIRTEYDHFNDEVPRNVLGKDLKEAVRVARENCEIARAKRMVAENEQHQKGKLALSQFDGKCPVAGISCPAKVEINSRVVENTDLLNKARIVYEAIRTEYDVAEQKLGTDSFALSSFERRWERLDRLSAQEESLRAAYEEAKKQPEPSDVADLQVRISAIQNVINDQHSFVDNMRRSFAIISDAIVEEGKLALEADILDKQIQTQREALVIFGKNGAQRRVAESALKVIQNGANEMLSECGINLDVEIYWSREGSGLAKTCDSCGNPFPLSRKVKGCERCGTERGPLLVNKLDIALSEQSGGSEDLAGACVQLSASRWLRANRNSRWSVALIDEPFGQLDASNRRAFSTHLATMLRSQFGFSQSFVIAHHSQVLDALPGRIEVIHDGRKATAKVIS